MSLPPQGYFKTLLSLLLLLLLLFFVKIIISSLLCVFVLYKEIIGINWLSQILFFIDFIFYLYDFWVVPGIIKLFHFL
jgi:ABC-type uncharacterized transport system permease subunit